MDREKEEIVQRITACYVEELRCGLQPAIGDYLARYPQYADEIASYIAYYHAFEEDLPDETWSIPSISNISSIPILSEQSQVAINSAWGRVAQAQSADKFSLMGRARELHLTIAQLADRLGISVDIVAKLERHTIDAATIPRGLLKQLAEVLQQPVQALSVFFDIPRQQVAETQTHYRIDDHVQSFREAIEESIQLSEERRRNWIEQLEQEYL